MPRCPAQPQGIGGLSCGTFDLFLCWVPLHGDGLQSLSSAATQRDHLGVMIIGMDWFLWWAAMGVAVSHVLSLNEGSP